MTNLFSDLLPKLRPELFTAPLGDADVRIERIVSHGHDSPEGFWYAQKQNESVGLLKGAATLRFEDGAVEMRPGDFLSIPTRTRHRIEWTTPDKPTIWLAVHYGKESS